jgi:hypothetical protein
MTNRHPGVSGADAAHPSPRDLARDKVGMA